MRPIIEALVMTAICVGLGTAYAFGMAWWSPSGTALYILLVVVIVALFLVSWFSAWNRGR